MRKFFGPMSFVGRVPTESQVLTTSMLGDPPVRVVEVSVPAYGETNSSGAEDILSSLGNDCIWNKDVDPVLVAEIGNDFALAAHRSGDDGPCLGALVPYSPWRGTPNPLMRKLPTRLRRAIVFNFKICESCCAITRAPAPGNRKIRWRQAQFVEPRRS
jgi:hypothetical protein